MSRNDKAVDARIADSVGGLRFVGLLEEDAMLRKLLALGLFIAVSVGLFRAAVPVAFLAGDLFPPELEPSVFSTSITTMLGFVTASLVFAGVALYQLRRAFRLYYGLIEIAVGVLLLYLTVKILLYGHSQLSGYFSDNERKLSVSLQIGAALYVLVRGLDNICAGLRPGSWTRKCWDRIFPGAD